MDRKKIIAATFACIAISSLPSCAVVQATKQPEKKDLSILRVGAYRTTLIAELGKPISTEMEAGEKVDVFKFIQGYSKITKAARALGHGVADVATLFVWEAVGTPIEGMANGEENQLEVHYKNNRVTKFIPLRGRAVRANG
jgi:hypothetical protein